MKKKLIVVEDGYSVRGAVADICRLWPDDLEIFSSSNEQEIIRIMKAEEIDLIIFDLSSGYGPQIDELASLTYMFPYTPCLAITGKMQKLEEEVLKRGASLFLKSPPRPAELRLLVHELLKTSNSGVVRGIPVHSLLQVLELDEKTCTLKVEKADQTGLIYLQDGAVVGAETSSQANEDAVYTILAWDDTTIEIRHYNKQRPCEIQMPMMSLIMEAFRLKDERDSREDKKKDSQKIAEPESSRVTAAGSYFSLDIGDKITMEVDDADSTFMCEMVGMVAEKFLLVTSPKPADLARKVLRSDSQIIIKYIHMGRLCIFKTKIMDAITSPQRMLFLNYPAVVHFHELRKAKRTAIFVPSTLKNNGGEGLSGVLVDMSSMGCLYRAKVEESAGLPKLDIDSKVTLSCFLPGITDSQVLEGIVKNIKKSSAELLLGIEFMGMADILRTAIERYVQSVDSLVER